MKLLESLMSETTAKFNIS